MNKRITLQERLDEETNRLKRQAAKAAAKVDPAACSASGVLGGSACTRAVGSRRRSP